MILKYEGIQDFSLHVRTEIPQTDNPSGLTFIITDDFTFDDQKRVKDDYFDTLKEVIETLEYRKWDLSLFTGSKDKGSTLNLRIKNDFTESIENVRKAEERSTFFITEKDCPHINYDFNRVELENVHAAIDYLYKDIFAFNLRQATARNDYQKEQDKLAERGVPFNRNEKTHFKLPSTTIRYVPLVQVEKKKEKKSRVL